MATAVVAAVAVAAMAAEMVAEAATAAVAEDGSGDGAEGGGGDADEVAKAGKRSLYGLGFLHLGKIYYLDLKYRHIESVNN